MSADTLRRAASLMRERAEAVSYPSPWSVGGGTCSVRCNDGRNYVASTYGGVGTEEVAAAHIASWHPTVALAVADWLEATADRHDAILDNFTPGSRVGAVTAAENVTAWEQALAVAHAYLGESQ
jgi:hypothetical protein